MPADQSQHRLTLTEQEDAWMQRNGSSNNSMWMKRSMLELIMAQQHLSSRAFCAVITTIAFKKKGRHDKTSQRNIFASHVWYKICSPLCKINGDVSLSTAKACQRAIKASLYSFVDLLQTKKSVFMGFRMKQREQSHFCC